MINIKGRNVQSFSCYMDNIPENVAIYQKKVFDKFDMSLIQELTNLEYHHEWLNEKIKSTDFDVLIFFDIDCVPLKLGLYEYIVDSINDNNSIMGVQQVCYNKNKDFIYAGPACFAITRSVYEKMNKPTFDLSDDYDAGGEFTKKAIEYDVNIKYFNIKSSLNKRWKCGNKYFGNGTIYDGWLYHQFEVRHHYFNGPERIYSYQFIKKCKEILEN
jgi:hypothetical protein